MFPILLILFYIIFSSFSLKEKIDQAQIGDFIVSQQSKNYYILFIRHLDASILQLEEISIPEAKLKSIKNQWQDWIKQGAPGHTAWVVYTIDLKKNEMKECYSFNRKGWLSINQQEAFLIALFSLPLEPVASSQRRRIGPPPINGEIDRRAMWNPPVIINGKKGSQPNIKVFTTNWPDDDSPLAHCKLELYFDGKRPDFLFPCWIEISTPHYTQNVRIIDSGTGMHSLHRFLPTQIDKERKL